jgi:hypothetical protein
MTPQRSGIAATSGGSDGHEPEVRGDSASFPWRYLMAAGRSRAPTMRANPPRSDRAPENFWDFADRFLDRMTYDWNWNKTLQLILIVSVLLGGVGWAAHALAGLSPLATGIALAGCGAGAGFGYRRANRRRAPPG